MEIKLEDIANAVNFIDLMVSRGAIRGEEAYNVGLFRNRLSEIIEFYQKEDNKSSAVNQGDETVVNDY